MIPRKPDSRSNDGMGQDIDMEIDHFYELQITASQASVAECLGCRYMRSSLVFRLVYSGTWTSLSSSWLATACVHARTVVGALQGARCPSNRTARQSPRSTSDNRWIRCLDWRRLGVRNLPPAGVGPPARMTKHSQPGSHICGGRVIRC
jgi:hypothetical protein